MFLLHADISENGFYTIFWIFNRSVTKLEDADEFRSIDGIFFKLRTTCHKFFWSVECLWIVNFYFKSYTFCLYSMYECILYLHAWIRIRIPNTDPDPKSSWIRIQYGSGSTTLSQTINYLGSKKQKQISNICTGTGMH